MSAPGKLATWWWPMELATGAGGGSAAYARKRHSATRPAQRLRRRRACTSAALAVLAAQLEDAGHADGSFTFTVSSVSCRPWRVDGLARRDAARLTTGSIRPRGALNNAATSFSVSWTIGDTARRGSAWTVALAGQRRGVMLRRAASTIGKPRRPGAGRRDQVLRHPMKNGGVPHAALPRLRRRTTLVSPFSPVISRVSLRRINYKDLF